MPDRIRVTAAEFVRNIGRWQSEALQRPVSITHHGHERLVLTSAARFSEASVASGQTERFDQRIYQDLVHHLRVGWLLFDEDWIIQEHNAPALSLLGVEAETLVSERPSSFLLPMHSRALEEALERAQISGSEVVIQLEIKAPQGGPPREREITAFSVGRFVQVIVRDADDQARLRRLQAIAAAADYIFCSSPLIGKLVLDARTRIADGREQLAELLGLEPKHLEGIHLTDLIRPADRKKFVRYFDACLDSSTLCNDLIYFMRRDAKDVPIKVCLARIDHHASADREVLAFLRLMSPEELKQPA
jgi:PAS domain-containing protein